MDINDHFLDTNIILSATMHPDNRYPNVIVDETYSDNLGLYFYYFNRFDAQYKKHISNYVVGEATKVLLRKKYIYNVYISALLNMIEYNPDMTREDILNESNRIVERDIRNCFNENPREQNILIKTLRKFIDRARDIFIVGTTFEIKTFLNKASEGIDKLGIQFLEDSEMLQQYGITVHTNHTENEYIYTYNNLKPHVENNINDVKILCDAHNILKKMDITNIAFLTFERNFSDNREQIQTELENLFIFGCNEFTCFISQMISDN